MKRFLLARAAARDVRDIYSYIAAEKPTAAIKVREQLFAAFIRIAEHPGIGHVREGPYRQAGTLLAGESLRNYL